MAIPKKQRFKSENIKLELRGIPSMPFPPEKITYRDKKLVLLGKSNKDDLFPPSLEDRDLMIATQYSRIGQFVYSAENADLYDALLYIDEVDNVVLYSIRTRLL